MSRGFKTNDETALLKEIESGKLLKETIMVLENMKGSGIISPPEDMAEVKWLSFAISVQM